jgi:hypothetical protein
MGGDEKQNIRYLCSLLYDNATPLYAVPSNYCGFLSVRSHKNKHSYLSTFIIGFYWGSIRVEKGIISVGFIVKRYFRTWMQPFLSDIDVPASLFIWTTVVAIRSGQKINDATLHFPTVNCGLHCVFQRFSTFFGVKNVPG